MSRCLSICMMDTQNSRVFFLIQLILEFAIEESKMTINFTVNIDSVIVNWRSSQITSNKSIIATKRTCHRKHRNRTSHLASPLLNQKSSRQNNQPAHKPTNPHASHKTCGEAYSTKNRRRGKADLRRFDRLFAPNHRSLRMPYGVKSIRSGAPHNALRNDLPIVRSTDWYSVNNFCV